MSTQLTGFHRQGEKEIIYARKGFVSLAVMQGFSFASESIFDKRRNKMQKVTKKILSVILVFVIAMTAWVSPAEAVETGTSGKNTVTVTVEKLTIGQGYLVEPMQVEIQNGDTVAAVFERVMKLKGITYPSTEGQYGFYLGSIDNADTGIINIPKEISDMSEVILWNGDIAKAPTNEINDGNPYEKGGLGDGSYNTMAGWQYTLNNENTGVGADQALVKNGDVIRWQFSVYGYGADLGFDTESFTGLKQVYLANKDVLTREVATVNADAEMLKNAEVNAARDKAMSVLINYSALQSEVDAEAVNLQKAIETYKKNIDEPEKIILKKASIKSLKNIRKYKAKIKVRKVSKATGYQYKYSANKRFKKAKVKTTTKMTLITKKFKKKQRCYVLVRAYVKVDGTRQFGRWSNRKSVKIKK